LPWDQYFSLLKPNGTFILVGVTEKPLTFHGGPFLGHQLKFAGSLVASRHVSNKMLQFAARHNIKPQIEEYPMVSEYTMKKKEKLIYVDPLSRAESGI
jgi:D-arabinose 1-dehydrogenase-like Zn-dependent alcohol dehydrogenase